MNNYVIDGQILTKVFKNVSRPLYVDFTIYLAWFVGL